MTAFMVAPAAMYSGSTPIRDPKYKRWLKRFPCVGCGGTRWIDPMHTGPHATAQKSSDMDCLPGCRKCHDEFDADPRGFAASHDMDVPALIRSFNRLWDLKTGRAS